jgi:imidazolonepropionase-like amidohydrolase
MRVTRILKKTVKYLGILGLVILLVVCASIPLARMEHPGDLLAVNNKHALAINNVNLVTMNGDQVLMNQQILIRDGIIEQFGPAGQADSSGYRLIDANGAYLLPGLFDMHVHAFDRKYLALTLSFGVTSVRNMGGYPMHLRWKQELADGQWLGSNLYAAAPIMNGKKNSNPLAHKVVTEPEKARAMVRRYHEQGWDFVKVYTRLSPPVYSAIIDEAAKLDFPVAGHVPYQVVETDYRLAAPMVTLEHTEEIFQGPLDYAYDDDAVIAIARQLKEMNATVTPTLLIFDHLTQIAREKQAFVDTLPLHYLNPFMRFVEGHTSGARWLNASDKTRDAMEKRNTFFQEITRVLHDNDVNLVLGSDSGIIFAVPGLSTHDEIALLSQAGLANHAILRMATLNAARALGVDDRFGSVEEGKIADLVMTEVNPLTDLGALRAPFAVVKNGQWLGRAELQQLKTSAENPSNAYFTFGRLLEFVFGG